MAHQTLTPNQKRIRRRGMIVSLATVAPLLVILFLIAPLLPDGRRRVDDTLAIAVGFMLLHMGVITAFTVLAFPKEAAIQRQRLAQVLSSLLSGVILFLPPFAERFIDPRLTFAIIIVLTGLSLVTTGLVWRAADELMRALMRDAWLACFFVVFTALMVYAAGERLGLLGGVTAWGAFGFASVVNIACSYWAIYRHGLDKPPAEE